MRMILVVFAATTILLGLAGARDVVAQKSYRVIVHPDNPIKTISKRTVSQMLLKQVSRWENGKEVEPVDLDSKSSVRKAFSRDVHGRSVSSIKNYWQRQIFSGREAPPPEVGSEAEVISFIKSNPGGIGYVSPDARLDGVKVLMTADE